MIRRATLEDVSAIALLAIECFPGDFLDGKSDTKKAIRYAQEWIKKRMMLKDYSCYHVALIDKKVVGYIYTFMIGGLSGIVQLEQIGVASPFRRQGVGQALISASEQFWRNYFPKKFKKPLYKMLLTTSEMNNKAHNLYARCGFMYETTIKDLYWGSNEEIWIKKR